jgi:hypothetical protein
MDFSTTRLWFARLVMVYAFAINAFLGWLYMFEPQKHIAKFGVAVSGVPESLNFLRAGPGAMFTALAVTALYGLLRPERFLACLWFIVLLTACVVAARLYGITVDGVTPLQLSELRDEGISWMFFALSLLAYPRTAKPG